MPNDLVPRHLYFKSDSPLQNSKTHPRPPSLMQELGYSTSRFSERKQRETKEHLRRGHETNGVRHANHRDW